MSETPPSQPTASRDAIIDILKRHGPQSAAAMAKQLSLTPMAVRLQLYGLEDDGVVSSTPKPAGRGRPTLIWSLTDASSDLFPDNHQGLALEMIQSIRDLFGEEGMTRVIDRHSDIQRTRYSEELSSARSLGDRVRRLATLRTEEGYMAEAKKDGGDWLLIENHCPICAAATACTRLCANELQVFREALGAGVEIRREDHILAGARRCAYRITPSGKN